MDTLGKRIKLARGKVSQDHFSNLLKISKGSLGFYERDENLPNTSVILKICSETGVGLEWLMTGHGSMRPDTQQEAPYATSADVQPTETIEQNTCPRCAELKKELSEEKEERRELARENRQLWKENASLREENAVLRANHQPPAACDNRKIA